jgi:hypothetical protein
MRSARPIQPAWSVLVLLFTAAVANPSLSAQNSDENAAIPDAEFLEAMWPTSPAERRAARFAVTSSRDVVTKELVLTVQEEYVEDDDPPARHIEFTLRIFDELVFGRGSNSEPACDKLQKDLRRRIEAVGQVCRLTEAQTKKLELAGCGDIKHFFDRVEQLRHRFNEPDSVDGGIREATRRVAELARETLPLQRVRHAGLFLFGDDSLYMRTLRGMATAEQIDQITARLAEFRDPREFVPQPTETRGRLRRVQLSQPAPAAAPILKE